MKRQAAPSPYRKNSSRPRNRKRLCRYDRSWTCLPGVVGWGRAAGRARTAQRLQLARASRIGFGLQCIGMLTAVYFHDEFLGRTREVDNISGDRHLPAEG